MVPMHTRLSTLTLTLVLLAFGLSPAAAQTPPTRADDPALTAIRADLERLRQEVADMRGDVRAVRELLQRLAAPPSAQAPPRTYATVTTGDNPTLGRRDAPVTIVEFSDYECPFCRQFVTTTMPALKSGYVDTGKVRWVFRDFPIDRIHPNARKASEAARCAGDQGKYWQMHDALFQNPQALTADRLPEHASALGLDRAAFEACLASGKHANEVQKNYADGTAAGVRGTPSFVVGRTRTDDTVEGVMIVGARPLADFRQEIERVLSEK